MISSLFNKYERMLYMPDHDNTDVPLAASILVLSEILNRKFPDAEVIKTKVNNKLHRNFKAKLQKVVDVHYSGAFKVSVYEETEGSLFYYSDIAVKLGKAISGGDSYKIANKITKLADMLHLHVDAQGIISMDKNEEL